MQLYSHDYLCVQLSHRESVCFWQSALCLTLPSLEKQCVQVVI